ncbi:MAG: BamA/TamA family outer membrane protein, partial [Pseudomonadota bacterium]
DLRGYTAFGAEDSTRLAARLQVGTVAGGNITDLPPGFLFFSGGGGTVRGQDFRSLGAEQNGQDTGGRTFIGLSGEVRQDITETIGVVAFYDAGYIAADAIWDDTGEWHSGAGLGVRYATPLGAIRLDVAAPVSGPDADNPIYIYIGIGQAF